MRLKYFWPMVLFVAFFLNNGDAHELLGVKIPDKIEMWKTQEKLLLNGCAIHPGWGEPLYVGALYTKPLERSAQMLLLSDQPMVMVFYFVRDDLTPEVLKHFFTESILINNGFGEGPAFDAIRLSEFQQILGETREAGDVLMVQYLPERGTTLWLNGKIVRDWPDAKIFFNMLLRIWLGAYPPSREFKQNMMAH